MNRTLRLIPALLAALAAGACAHVAQPGAAGWQAAAVLNSTGPSTGALRTSKGLSLAALSRQPGRDEIEDRSVGIAGMLGQSINEIVPIPGADMIQVGTLKDGTLLQSNFRAASQEATTRGGTVQSEATIIFRITRP
jgi:hypothetical protein